MPLPTSLYQLMFTSLFSVSVNLFLLCYIQSCTLYFLLFSLTFCVFDFISYIFKGFSYSSVGKEFACSAGNLGSIPGLGRSPGKGNGNPLQYPCLENLMDRGAWWAAVRGVAKSQTQLNTKSSHMQYSPSIPFSLLLSWPLSQSPEFSCFNLDWLFSRYNDVDSLFSGSHIFPFLG